MQLRVELMSSSDSDESQASDFSADGSDTVGGRKPEWYWHLRCLGPKDSQGSGLVPKGACEKGVSLAGASTAM